MFNQKKTNKGHMIQVQQEDIREHILNITVDIFYVISIYFTTIQLCGRDNISKTIKENLLINSS